MLFVLGSEYTQVKEIYSGEVFIADSIIGVHGLNADSRYTWSRQGTFRHANPKSEHQQKPETVNWLRDFLPKAIPNARILVFNYSSPFLPVGSTKSTYAISKTFLDSLVSLRGAEKLYRPMVFVGHSFGGIVINKFVDENSATIDGSRSLALDKDHSGLNKFTDEHDADYKMIVEKLGNIVNSIDPYHPQMTEAQAGIAEVLQCGYVDILEMTSNDAGLIESIIDGNSRLRNILPGSIDNLTRIVSQILAQPLSKERRLVGKSFLFVIDSLDECAESSQAELLRLLGTVTSTSPTPFKFLVTCTDTFLSQPGRALDDWKLISMVANNAADIKHYVHGTLREWATTPERRRNVPLLEKEMNERADGLFLWADLVIRGLLRRSYRSDLELNTLRTFPRDRDDMLKRLYEEILRRITADFNDSEAVDDLKSILSVVLFASPPLAVVQLQQCLACDGRTRFNLTGDLRGFRAGLLKIQGDCVFAVHDTLKLFLQDKALAPASLHIEPANANARLARVCLRYSYDRITSISTCDSDELDRLHDDQVFLCYAADRWLCFANAAGENTPLLVPLIRSLFNDMHPFMKWQKSVTWYQGSIFYLLKLQKEQNFMTTPTPAHLLSLLGLSEALCHELFSNDDHTILSRQSLGSANTDEEGRVPLHWPAANQSGGIHSFAFMPNANRIFNILAMGCDQTQMLKFILKESPESCHSRDKLGLQPLHLASELGGSPTAIEILLDAGADPNAKTLENSMPLQRACGPFGLAQKCKLLLDYGADIHAKSVDGITPLHVACVFGNLSIVEVLLEYDADASAKGETHELTPLHSLVLKGRQLEEHGAEINSRGNMDFTPLFIAARFVKLSTIDLLIQNGATVDAGEEGGENGLFQAIGSRDEGCVRHVLERMKELNMPSLVNTIHDSFRTPLYLALCIKKATMMSALIDYGADMEFRYQSNQTALHIAVVSGYAEEVRVLLNNGADIKTKDCNGRTPLFFAAILGNVAAVEILLAFGADINISSKGGLSPVHGAIYRDDPTRVRMLLENSADPKAITDGGNCLFDLAMSTKSSIQVLEVLCEDNAPIEIVSTRPDCLLRAALAYKWLPGVRFLLDHHVSLGSHAEDVYANLLLALHDGEEMFDLMPRRIISLAIDVHMLCQAIYFKDERMVRALLECGARVEGFTREQLTPIHTAVASGQSHIVELLLSRGADVELRTLKGGYTALHIAANPEIMKIEGLFRSVTRTDKHKETVNTLIRKGANINAQARDGTTPLIAAVHGNHSGIIVDLIAAGADLDLENNEGHTAIQVAAEMDNPEALEQLLKGNPNLETRDKDLMTAMHYAALKSAACFCILHENGASLEVREEDGFAPIHIARAAANVGAVSYCHRENVGLHLRDHHGRVGLDVAVPSVRAILTSGQSDQIQSLVSCKNATKSTNVFETVECSGCYEDIDEGFYIHCCSCEFNLTRFIASTIVSYEEHCSWVAELRLPFS
ncbi:hypothetical protein V500_01607 [Pseudogymnoascus sp. VKM F-4518 (FW-2643)]|nr:hypothetical protein V500_01607 [Pseudogymnoascus sp. VKM F-4518 (FW-2643)]